MTITNDNGDGTPDAYKIEPQTPPRHGDYSSIGFVNSIPSAASNLHQLHFRQSAFAGAKSSAHSTRKENCYRAAIRHCRPQTISLALLPYAAEYVYFSGEMPVGSQRSLPGEVGRTLGGWFVAQIKVVLILTGIYAIGFAISRVPWWFAVAVVCGLSNFIPIVGAVIALLIILPLTWLVSQDTMSVLGALITYVVAQGLEGFYLTPKIMGRRLGLSPWVVFLAILAGGFVFGPLGVVFAAPVVAVLAILWRRSRRANVQD